MSHVISAIRPAWVVPGGRVVIDGTHFPILPDGPPHVLVGSHDAHVVGASHRAIRFVVPAEAEGGRTAVHIDELPGERAELEIARPLSTGLHLVDSPAFDRDGRLYVTQSGGRGTKVPVPLYRLAADGVREPLAVEIANPTSLALGPDGAMYISSRFDGHVHRLTADDRVEIYATELGVPTGLAFAADGSLFVGDRSGSILRVSPDRTVETFAQLPASVAAFHLAMGPDGCLYVAAPTFATHDPIYRITPERLVDVVNDRARPPARAGVRLDRQPLRRRRARRRSRPLQDRCDVGQAAGRARPHRAGAHRPCVRPGRRHRARLERQRLEARRWLKPRT